MAKLELEVQSFDKVKTLIELLSKYEYALPDELNNSLRDLADCEACEFNHKRLESMGVGHDLTIKVDGVESRGVVSANKILKRITVYSNVINGDDLPEAKDGAFVESFLYPESFSIKDNDSGITIVEW